MLLATGNGVFRRALDASTPWAPSGLPGQLVDVIYPSQLDDHVVLAGLAAEGSDLTTPSVQRSEDGGKTWTSVGAAFRDPFESDFAKTDVYDSIASITSYTAAGKETFFVNGSGLNLARSPNGKDFTFIDGSGEAAIGECRSYAAATLGAFVYQGCEAPLDSAWLRRLKLDAKNGDAGESLLTISDLGNRMPNVLTSSTADPGALYMGVEGGLVRWMAGKYSWVFKSEGSSSPVPYIYVRAVWVDPCDAKHIVFAGLEQGINPLGDVYETPDGGKTFKHVTLPPLGAFTSLEFTGGVVAPDQRTLVLSITLDRKGANGDYNPPEKQRAYALALTGE